MSRGKHERIEIPPHWWVTLDNELRRKRRVENVERLCEEKRGTLSPKTIANAKKKGWMTISSVQKLSELLGHPTSQDLRDEWKKASDDAARSERAGASVSPEHPPENPTERLFTAQENMPQWADHFEADLGNRRLEAVSCNIDTDSPYFRFGFKLLTEQGRVFGDAAIRSNDANLIVHVGRNNWDRTNPAISARDIFLTWALNGIKRGKDEKLFTSDLRLFTSVNLFINSGNVAVFSVNGKSCLSTVIPPELRRRLVLIAWGDSEEFEVRASDIRVQTLPLL